MAVAAFGDGTLPARFPGGSFVGHQAEIGHELLGMLKTGEVPEFTDQDAGCDEGDAT